MTSKKLLKRFSLQQQATTPLSSTHLSRNYLKKPSLTLANSSNLIECLRRTDNPTEANPLTRSRTGSDFLTSALRAADDEDKLKNPFLRAKLRCLLEREEEKKGRESLNRRTIDTDEAEGEQLPDNRVTFRRVAQKERERGQQMAKALSRRLKPTVPQ